MNTPIRTILGEKKRNVVTITADSSVADAVEEMNRNRVGAVLVVAEHKPVGIFTERDVLVRVIAARTNPDDVCVRDVMTRALITVVPTTTVIDAMLIMSQHRCRHLPIVEGGALAGMISIGDLTDWIVRHQQHRIDDLHRYISGGYPTAELAVP